MSELTTRIAGALPPKVEGALHIKASEQEGDDVVQFVVPTKPGPEKLHSPLKTVDGMHSEEKERVILKFDDEDEDDVVTEPEEEADAKGHQRSQEQLHHPEEEEEPRGTSAEAREQQTPGAIGLERFRCGGGLGAAGTLSTSSSRSFLSPCVAAHFFVRGRERCRVSTPGEEFPLLRQTSDATSVLADTPASAGSSEASSPVLRRQRQRRQRCRQGLEKAVSCMRQLHEENDVLRCRLQESVEEHLSLARVQFWRKDLTAARRGCAAALKVEPRCADARVLLSRIETERGEFALAEKSAMAALEEEPSRVDAQTVLVELEKRQADKRRRSDLRGTQELQRDVQAAEAMLAKVARAAERWDWPAAPCPFLQRCPSSPPARRDKQPVAPGAGRRRASVAGSHQCTTSSARGGIDFCVAYGELKTAVNSMGQEGGQLPNQEGTQQPGVGSDEAAGETASTASEDKAVAAAAADVEQTPRPKARPRTVANTCLQRSPKARAGYTRDPQLQGENRQPTQERSPHPLKRLEKQQRSPQILRGDRWRQERPWERQKHSPGFRGGLLLSDEPMVRGGRATAINARQRRLARSGRVPDCVGTKGEASVSAPGGGETTL